MLSSSGEVGIDSAPTPVAVVPAQNRVSINSWATPHRHRPNGGLTAAEEELAPIVCAMVLRVLHACNAKGLLARAPGPA